MMAMPDCDTAAASISIHLPGGVSGSSLREIIRFCSRSEAHTSGKECQGRQKMVCRSWSFAWSSFSEEYDLPLRVLRRGGFGQCLKIVDAAAYG